jgi:multiple sugar transport system substrate-binding protein
VASGPTGIKSAARTFYDPGRKTEGADEMSRLTRRQFTGHLAGTALAGAGLGGFARKARAETTLRWFWWGNPERNKRTYAVVDLYDEHHPDIVIEAETIGWDDYWPKMATQASGRNMPDVVQMDYRYLFEYARRRQLEPLDDYGDLLDLSQFDESFLNSGRVGDQLYAVPWTSNSIACFYDQEKFAELGITMPDHTWTYDDLRTLASEVKKQGIENYWGVADKGHWEPAFECFLRQRGKALYLEDGSLGHGVEDVADYFGLWQGLRDEGLVPTPEITVRDTELSSTPLTTGNAAIDFAHSNQLVALQSLNPHQLGVNMFPNGVDGKPGQYVKPSMLISVSATSPVKDEAVKFTSFLASDLDAAAILRVERGVPGDRRVREFLSEEVDPLERMMIDYLAIVADNVSPLPPPPPKGAGEIDKMLLRLYPEVTFKRLSATDAASEFHATAESILRRS